MDDLKYVVVEMGRDYGCNDEYICNVYGIFNSLLAAEDFRNKHPNRADLEPYLLTDYTEALEE